MPDQAKAISFFINHEPDQVPVPDQAKAISFFINHEPDQVHPWVYLLGEFNSLSGHNSTNADKHPHVIPRFF